MRNDIIKYIAIILAIIFLIWWLLVKDNSMDSSYEDTGINPISVD